MRFTTKSIRSIELPAEFTDYIVWDDAMPSFGIRFQNSSPRGTYIVQYRLGSKQRRKSLGRVGKVTLEAAQTEAQQYFADVAKKVDPALARQAAARKLGKALAPMIDPFLGYLEHDKKRAPTYVDENRRSLNRYFKKLHQFAPDDISREMVSTELGTIKREHGPVAMMRSRSHLSRFFNWMIGEGHANNNPVSGTNRIDQNVRDRLLKPDEIVTMWNACSGDEESDKIVRLLILTAARRAQIGDLQKRELNLRDKQIEFPGRQGRSKNKEMFLLPLSDQALSIFDTITPRPQSQFVFGEGEGGFSGWSNLKERIDRIIDGKVTDWTFHDFRAAFDTYVQDKCKVAPHISDLLLSHKGEVRKGVRKHYNFASYLEEKTDAMQKWGDYVEGLVKPKLRAVA